jgi:putative flippase GtrA
MVTAVFRRLGLLNPGSFVHSWIFQMIKFASVGMINTGVDLGIYFLLTSYVSFFGDFVFLSKAFSYSVGVITSYSLNQRWTFKSIGSSHRQFLSFVVVNLFSVVLNAGLLTIFVMILRLNQVVAIFFVTSITFAWNFLASKFLVFNDNAKQRMFQKKLSPGDDIRMKASALAPRFKP